MILNTANIRTNDCRGKSTREATEKGTKRILRVVVSLRNGPLAGGSVSEDGICSSRRSREHKFDIAQAEPLETWGLVTLADPGAKLNNCFGARTLGSKA